MELRVLLLKGFHAAFKMHLQPLAAMNGEELHPFRHVATFIYSANDVCKGVIFACTEVRLPTGSTIVVGNVASAESELANAIVESCFLKIVWRILFKHHRLNNLFQIEEVLPEETVNVTIEALADGERRLVF